MPVRGNTLYCPICDHAQPQINFVDCEACGHDLGAPNVNTVSTEDEQKALRKRYEEAKEYCSKNGTEDVLHRFEEFFSKNARAVKNMKFEILNEWVRAGAYKTYHRAVEDGERKIADLFNDRKRTIIDSFLYGSHGRDINFAAVALNNQGLDSYGNCTVFFKEDSIKLRTSTLEENSYNFVKTHNINFESPDIPLGYRSTWSDKLKLAVAKVYRSFTPKSTDKSFCNSVLLSTNNTHRDEFIELHIYKELTILVVDFIFIPTPKNKPDELSAKVLEAKLPGKITRI